MAGLLPREVREVIHSPCSLCFYGCLESYLSICWQHHQEKGMSIKQIVGSTGLYAWKFILSALLWWENWDDVKQGAKI